MSYELAVAWSIIRSLLAGVLCLGLARVLVRWKEGRMHHGGTEARSGVLGGGAFVTKPSLNLDCAEPEVGFHFPVIPTSRCLGASVVNHSTDGSGRRSGLVWALVLIPFFMPGLVVGYAYRNASLSLVQTPLLNEVLYLAIVVAQLTPVIVLALEWLPAAEMGRAAAYLLRLTANSGRTTSLGSRIRGLLAGEFPRQATAGAMAALLCFQEVEVATLMQARGWAEWIFTKQAGGVELVEVWQFLVLPLVYGLVLTVPVLLFWMLRSESGGKTGDRPLHEASGSLPSSRAIGWLILAAMWGLVVVWPVVSLAIGAFRGAGVIRFRAAIWQEIGDALVLGVTVTLVLWLILWMVGRLNAGGTLRSVLKRTGRLRVRWVAVAMLLPGLLGSLALGLTIFEICQRIGVQPSYSPVPLVAGMVLFLLPRAMAMQAILQRNERSTGVFQAESLTPWPGRRSGWGWGILWGIRDAGRFWTLALLFWWSYLELTLPALLRPAGMAPAPLRLYNFLHYGHIPGLAAMLLVVLIVPGVLLWGVSLWLRGIRASHLLRLREAV